MPSKHLVAATLAAATLTTVGTSLTSAPAAQAATNQCAIIQSTTVGGFTWTKMPTTRVCSNTLKAGVAGQANLGQRRIVVQYSASRTSALEATKATVHELSHHVEYRTTAAHRAKLYSFIGLKNPTGNYFAYNDAYYYNGSLARWKQSPRERLAESVVNCKFGTPNHTGMALVPRSQCAAFLTEFRAALAVAR